MLEASQSAHCFVRRRTSTFQVISALDSPLSQTRALCSNESWNFLFGEEVLGAWLLPAPTCVPPAA